MFNIYYINYAKAYEIAMLLDNKILEKKTKERVTEGNLSATAGVDGNPVEKIPFVGKYMPKMELSGEVTGAKSSKVIDTVNVITTKSTILERIYDKAKAATVLQSNKIGNLIKIKNVSFKIKNENDILGTKTLLSGALGDIPVDGIGELNLSNLFEVLLKDSAYILEGILPKDKFKQNEKIVIKIPMQAENELENQYSLSDLEIGKVTIIGIYRGKYPDKELYGMLNRLSDSNNDTVIDDLSIESDEEEKDDENSNAHYIDIIAVVQDIIF